MFLLTLFLLLFQQLSILIQEYIRILQSFLLHQIYIQFFIHETFSETFSWKKQKKFRHESKNFRFYVIKHIFIAREQKNSESGKTFGVNL